MNSDQGVEGIWNVGGDWAIGFNLISSIDELGSREKESLMEIDELIR
jgi:hypothetical protein